MGVTLAESGHKLAAKRLCEDEYENYLCNPKNLNDESSECDFFGNEIPELVQGAQLVKAKGRLKECVKYWESIGASQFIITTIKSGYTIPFLHTPPRACFPNNKSTVEHKQFVTTAINELLDVGSIIECKVVPTVVNPLSVSVQHNGKKRLILDLRYPNSYIKKCSVKFEDAKSMLELLTNPPQYWMFSFDIKSGYHHIDISPNDQEFLGFAWDFDSEVRYFIFTVLPFGLSTGPYIFTKVMRPLVKHWRSNACRIVVYLDDGLGASPSLHSAQQHSLSVKTSLISSGFIPNSDKCHWCPTQRLIWLGLDWDLLNQVLKIPEERIARLLTKLYEALANGKDFMNVRQLASVTGLIMSNILVFGNICKLMTKALYRTIESRSHWRSKLTLDYKAIRELEFWVRESKRLNFRFISSEPPSSSRIVYSDASNTGCAAYIELDDTPIFYKTWSEIEMRQSSAWRELQCINYALPSFRDLLASQTVKWFTDNQSVKSILESGSMKLHLHKIALDVYYFTKHNNILLEVEWIPRTQNEKADYLSKMIDPEDWRVKDTYFQTVSAYWGNFTLDCFANSENRKTPRFYSKFYNPDSLGVDAFAFDWSGEFCWLAPPVSLISRVLRHVIKSSCLAVLVLPVWPSALFWPLLVEGYDSFRPIVIDCILVEHGKNVFEHGENKNSLFGSDSFNSAVVFLLLNGALN